jgi:putative restriction endonuclease
VDADELRRRFNSLTVWRRGGERAPHKPLLVIYAIARLLRGETRMVEYAEVDRDLGNLLLEFGPPRQSVHPEYPFWRLQNDELWELSRAEGLSTRRGNTDAKKSELLAHYVQGGFTTEVQDELARNKSLAAAVVQDLLAANFPATLHQDILDAVGIDSSSRCETRYCSQPGVSGARAPGIRIQLRGLRLRRPARNDSRGLGGSAYQMASSRRAGQGVQRFGPMYDASQTLRPRRFTLSENMVVIVSENANGTKGFQEWVIAFHGQAIRPPQRPTYYPDTDAVQWHVREVFKGPGRYGTGRS